MDGIKCNFMEILKLQRIKVNVAKIPNKREHHENSKLEGISVGANSITGRNEPIFDMNYIVCSSAIAPDAGATAPDAGATEPDAGATAPDADAKVMAAIAT